MIDRCSCGFSQSLTRVNVCLIRSIFLEQANPNHLRTICQAIKSLRQFLPSQVQTALLRLVDTHWRMSNKCLTFAKLAFAHHMSFKQMLHILTSHMCLRVKVRWPWRPRRVISTGSRKLLPKATARRSYATAEHEKWISALWNKIKISTCFGAFRPAVEEIERNRERLSGGGTTTRRRSGETETLERKKMLDFALELHCLAFRVYWTVWRRPLCLLRS